MQITFFFFLVVMNLQRVQLTLSGRQTTLPAYYNTKDKKKTTQRFDLESIKLITGQFIHKVVFVLNG